MAKGNGKAEQPERKPVSPIKAQHPTWKLAEHANNVFRAFVDSTVELEDLSKPALWQFVAHQLTEFDRVVVIREDRAFWAECLVVDVQPHVSYASVIVLQSTKLPPRRGENAIEALEGYEFYKDAPTGRWLAIRKADGARMNGDGSDTLELARRTVLDHATNRQQMTPRYM